MRNFLFLFCLVSAACLFPPAAKGFTQDELTIETFTETYSETYILSQIPDFTETPEGGTPWEMFGETGSIEIEEIDENGFNITTVRPEFTEELRALDGQEILMQGYMFPLEQGERQGRFLFGPFPMSCPYHYHVGPSLVMDVKPQNPLRFTFDPVNLKGRLELLEEDEWGVFYRLHEAVISSLE